MLQIDNRFNVRIVQQGGRYGRNLDCIHESIDPLVEFYDANQDLQAFGDLGQFVSRYYASTLLEGYEGCKASPADARGLLLDGGVSEWAISGVGMLKVIELVREVVDLTEP